MAPLIGRAVATPAKVALALAVGLVLVFLCLAASWVFNPDWDHCASMVEGRIIEHGCGESPRR